MTRRGDRFRVGVDIGGTFTDFILVDREAGRVRLHKCLDVSFVILLGSGLAFLGVGAQEPTPDWGAMVARGRTFLPTQWWMSTMPGLAIFVAVMGFNLLGDALRDALDVWDQ